MKTPWPLLLAACLLAGCGSSPSTSSASENQPAATTVPPASVPEGKEATLLPLDPGTQWVFSYEQTSQGRNGQPDVARMEMTWKVVSSAKTAEGVRSKIQVLKGDELIDQQDWLTTSKGIFQLNGSLNGVPYTPPQPILLFPVKTGQKYAWKGRGLLPTGEQGEMTSSTEVLGPQEVDTEQDRVSAIAVQSLLNFNSRGTSGQATVVSWFRPGVGIVRYHTELKVGTITAATTLRLKTSTVKQP